MRTTGAAKQKIRETTDLSKFSDPKKEKIMKPGMKENDEVMSDWTMIIIVYCINTIIT